MSVYYQFSSMKLCKKKHKLKIKNIILVFSDEMIVLLRKKKEKMKIVIQDIKAKLQTVILKMQSQVVKIKIVH